MGPLTTVHTPRLSFLMRGANQPVIRSPLVRTIKSAVPPKIAVGGVDMEYGASMQPRNNPAFNDLWIVGATGGANKVIPQGIDYSRTPCCMSGTSDVASLAVLVVGLPLIMLGVTILLGGR